MIHLGGSSVGALLLSGSSVGVLLGQIAVQVQLSIVSALEMPQGIKHRAAHWRAHLMRKPAEKMRYAFILCYYVLREAVLSGKRQIMLLHDAIHAVPALTHTVRPAACQDSNVKHGRRRSSL